MALYTPIKGIFFDAGWTLFYPTTEHWLMPHKCAEYIDPHVFSAIPKDRKDMAFANAMKYLDDNHLIVTEEEELEQFKVFYSMLSFDLPELDLTERKIEDIARSKVYDMDNYCFYDDTASTLKALQSRYKLGIISDTWPSIKRILEYGGIYSFFETKTFSSYLGTFKPDKLMYEHALKQMNLPPEQTIFIDDGVDNLAGAQECGIQPVLITAKPNSENSDRYPSIKKLSELLEILPN